MTSCIKTTNCVQLCWTGLYIWRVYLSVILSFFETFKFSFFFLDRVQGEKFLDYFFAENIRFFLERGSVVWRQYKGRWIFSSFFVCVVGGGIFHIFFLVGRDWKAEKSLFRYNMYISAQYKQFFLMCVDCSPQIFLKSGFLKWFGCF